MADLVYGHLFLRVPEDADYVVGVVDYVALGYTFGVLVGVDGAERPLAYEFGSTEEPDVLESWHTEARGYGPRLL